MAKSTLQVMDLTSLRAVLADLRAQIIPSRFEKAQQPNQQSLQLGFRTLKGMVWLELSWQADAARLVQIPPPSRIGSGSTLAQQVQHGLRQLALVDLEQRNFERVVLFHFAPRPGEVSVRTLVLELMGRHSNVLLLDDQKRITAIARQVRQHQSRVRPLSTGDPYLPPPALQSLPPSCEEPFEQWRRRLTLVPVGLGKALRDTYQGISPALTKQLINFSSKDQAPIPLSASTPVEEISDKQWQLLHTRWRRWLNQLSCDDFILQLDEAGGYRVWNDPADSSSNSESLSLRLGLYYRKHLNERQLLKESQDLQQLLEQSRQREQAQRLEQVQRLKATGGADDLQRQADAILCQAAPDRGSIEQAQKLYQRAKRLRRSIPLIEERLVHHDQRLALIDGSAGFLADLMQADWDEAGDRNQQLLELKVELEELLTPRRRRRRSGPPPGQPQPLEIRSQHGLVIQVGRNHRQNEWISLRQARAGDLWFHAQECPGSHVVLKASEAAAGEPDLQLAADLAAWFSRAKGNRRVPVVMTGVEHLQRIPGTAPGTVRHRQAELVWAEPDRAQKALEAWEPLA
ncbi:fibronectin-binding A family protein [Synechococcus sp. MIT S9220]|uniref:Rqc2 family fibronectin-binding protein n=1 Tax=unclassified Synechococcus TaxID=2626047 RepID=UPI00164C893E|nr:NFACT RNA binding domain-containing protein [Synechococcus sp. MIT S9220]NOL46317.1 fibronectin/fibrinogen-binding protein [Synechococcus sp. MIT S9220]QNJ23588.1 fibronectin-binding A family protein [Synechococcus sp. MIT S9220]